MSFGIVKGYLRRSMDLYGKAYEKHKILTALVTVLPPTILGAALGNAAIPPETLYYTAKDGTEAVANVVRNGLVLGAAAGYFPSAAAIIRKAV